MTQKSRKITIAILLILGGASLTLALFLFSLKPVELSFDSERAYADVTYQVELGPRTPGSQGHAEVIGWISDELADSQWDVELQETTYLGFPITNIVAKHATSPENPWIILGAHYDTRFFSDKETEEEKALEPVPGANDGASGVAVLLEIARVLPEDLNKNVWLVFFDEEDNGNIGDRKWAMGASAFVQELQDQPDSVVILDMIGDADLNIYFENNSDLELTAEIWAQAAALGHIDKFIPVPKYSIIDDHIPFLEAGIRAVDIIDFDYPYHHTTSDTLDKISPASLGAVGDTIVAWLIGMEN